MDRHPSKFCPWCQHAKVSVMAGAQCRPSWLSPRVGAATSLGSCKKSQHPFLCKVYEKKWVPAVGWGHDGEHHSNKDTRNQPAASAKHCMPGELNVATHAASTSTTAWHTTLSLHFSHVLHSRRYCGSYTYSCPAEAPPGGINYKGQLGWVGC